MMQPEGSNGTTNGWRQRLSIVVLFVGSLVFAAVAVACWAIADEAEQSLLQERADQAGTTLAVAIEQIRSPLDAAATLARVTGGDATYFEEALGDRVGDNGTFSGAALFRIGEDLPIATLGEPVVLDDAVEDSVLPLLDDTEGGALRVIDMLASGRRLGYLVVDNAQPPTYAVYGERILNPDPNQRQRSDEPFARLDYAIYLNDTEDAHLLSASVRELPLGDPTASTTIPFGDQELVLVMTPIGHLNGWFFTNLWWIVAALGAMLSFAAAWLTGTLKHRRDRAEELAADNARLYDEQRHIAETLQLSLLPQHLDPPPDATVSARYWPAGSASLIGGDFYDVFRVDENRWGVIIGDVCGKGISAAAITGLVRHTARAAARTSVSPSTVLHDVHDALADHRPSTFCTVCFVYVTTVDGNSVQLTLALGGHPKPLLRRANGTVVEVGEAGTLLGLVPPTMRDVTVPIEPGDTLVLYTDGLTDAPHDQGVPVEELITLLEAEGGRPVEELVDLIRPLKRRRRPLGSTDDTAILAVRFSGAHVGAEPPQPSTVG